MVKSVVNGIVTYYPSAQYQEQVNGSTTTFTKTYVFGSISVAVRTITGSQNVLNWVITDQINSTTVTANADGSLSSEIRYSAFGTIRYENGVTPTNYRYTGQLQQAVIGLYYYNARWYDPELGRFVQADTIIASASNPASYDRYAYVGNNPINHADPSGNRPIAGCEDDQYNCSPWPTKPQPVVPVPENGGGNGGNSSNGSNSPSNNENEDWVIKQLADMVANGQLSADEYETVIANITLAFNWINETSDWYRDPRNTYSFVWTRARLAYFFATIQTESSWGLLMYEDQSTRTEPVYYGRGFIQLTGEYNYQNMTDNFAQVYPGLNLVNNPDEVATNTELSMRIAIKEMISGGLTGYSLQQISSEQDFVAARNIVNPRDTQHAGDVAALAMNYLNFLNTVPLNLIPGNPSE